MNNAESRVISSAFVGDQFELLEAKLLDRTASVGIVGLGYVGLPLAHALLGGGFSIVGFDTDPRKIEMLEVGTPYLKHLGTQLPLDLAESDRFSATADMERVRDVDVVVVCVPTPVGAHEEPDLSFVLGAARDIGSGLRRGQLIVLESTTYPGTTREKFLPAMMDAVQRSDKSASRPIEVGRDIFLAYSPEREDPGRKSHETTSIPKLVGGVDERSGALAAILYESAISEIVVVDSAETAEAAKILENVFRAVNIALVNELKTVFSQMDIDVWRVIEAANTKPFGYMPFYPGPGLGGHCIPVDPFYLTWRAKEFGQSTRFIELAGKINRRMPHYVIEQVADALNGDGKAIKGSKILVVGLAYKANVDDTRESPSAEILKLLDEKGADLEYHDPHVPSFPNMRNYDYSMDSVELDSERLAAADCVLVVTAHDLIDWQLIADSAHLVVDTRNVMASVSNSKARIVKA